MEQDGLASCNNLFEDVIPASTHSVTGAPKEMFSASRQLTCFNELLPATRHTTTPPLPAPGTHNTLAHKVNLATQTA